MIIPSLITQLTVVPWRARGNDRLDVVPQRFADRLEDQRRNAPDQQIEEDVPLKICEERTGHDIEHRII